MYSLHCTIHLMTLDVNNGCVFILDENENPCINCEILFFILEAN